YNPLNQQNSKNQNIKLPTKENAMINNPNSAIQRMKNHLSYKLGQELIAFDTGGGGKLSSF
ncbi:hypothetical protein CHLV4142_10315, partial [Campylobacter helveticus]|uniref:hypothetical protein n=1 Tax=Campylobacter helveticus TaxID=28898 RepID=UPI00214A7485